MPAFPHCRSLRRIADGCAAVHLTPLPAPQDRCTIVPRVLGRDDVYFFGVFDGTVGDLAAAFVNTELPQKMLGAQVRKHGDGGAVDLRSVLSRLCPAVWSAPAGGVLAATRRTA